MSYETFHSVVIKHIKQEICLGYQILIIIIVLVIIVIIVNYALILLVRVMTSYEELLLSFILPCKD